ncbi:activating transcription factor of chaperone [Aricia agestis]|uniref:activating transcription factor of chaperone n=1 Tax=Aricia agestis TaxID=91739 RepID=UPI001C20AB89|nr:activating transcription factor of chaperone [Aricia agestis]
MSASKWIWPSASADNLLTDKECSMLLEEFDNDEDLFKTITSAAPKSESFGFGVQDDFSTLYPPSPPEIKPSQAELAKDILQQLENECKQENVLPNWFEEKTELSFFESIPHIPGAEAEVPLAGPGGPIPVGPVGPYAAQIVPQPTEELLREFETVYGVVKLTHLTPPQSPPGPATQLLLSYAQQAQAPPADQWPVGLPAAPPVDYDESQALEELVRNRAAQLASPHPSPRSSSPSPRSSPSSSPRSSTDEEWGAPSRPKPYSRAPDDRRSRKKEQNKNAATRYRQKKKAEIEVLLTEEQALCRRHAELGDKCADLQREIRYLKGLMRDLFKTKGLIK